MALAREERNWMRSIESIHAASRGTDPANGVARCHVGPADRAMMRSSFLQGKLAMRHSVRNVILTLLLCILPSVAHADVTGSMGRWMQGRGQRRDAAGQAIADIAKQSRNSTPKFDVHAR